METCRNRKVRVTIGTAEQNKSCLLYTSQQEIASLERHIHHDIDNWEMDMSKDLLDELKDLEKKCRSVNQRMKKDIARNS